ncbi:MAG: IS1595 family transposase [Ectothiorhodospiraceae bacterium AqS1]|nr:IS1595 family transposase [Ectothiorhodospiraceae bacterium AqS1]
MSQKAPGKHYRKGMSLIGLFRKFPTDREAEQWFVEQRWGNEPECPHCKSTRVQTGAKHPSMPYRCRDCGKRFSVKTGTVMQSSKLGFQVWLIAMYLVHTNIKGISSMRLHRELSITQRTAWFLGHRIRESFDTVPIPFAGPVEVDEAFFGGSESNKHQADRGKGKKTVIMGMKDRATKSVYAIPVEQATKTIACKFIKKHTAEDAPVYTDSSPIYRDIPRDHHAINHSIKQFVKGPIHTNGLESFWSLFRRGYHGVYHKMSPQHIGRYISEFAGRQNLRELDTINQMIDCVKGMIGKRLKYRELVIPTLRHFAI